MQLGRGPSSQMPEGTLTLSVASDPDEVEKSLLGGTLGCASCGGVLAPWGHARSRWAKPSRW